VVQNRFERLVKYLYDQGEAFKQSRVSFSCGCSVDLVPPKEQPGFQMGVSYVVNPCEKHPKGWDAVPNEPS
jgi:hypothetical protein